MNQDLKTELLALADEDQSLPQSIWEAGVHEDGAYHPGLKRLHEGNTQRTKKIIERYGWPAISGVGEEGSDAMWPRVRHSVLEPEFVMSCIPILEERVKEVEADDGSWPSAGSGINATGRAANLRHAACAG